VIERTRYLAALELVTKIVALAVSSPFPAERDAAWRKASELATRAGIRSINYMGTLYRFDRSSGKATTLTGSGRRTGGNHERRDGR
jgi:hypothetical protein